MTDWRDVSTALLGSWPSVVASWGKEGIAAYLGELQARGVTPDDALLAIRTSDGALPPSAGQLAKLTRRDPDEPTFEEAFAQIYGPGGVFGFRRAGVTVSTLVLAFVESYGRGRLRHLDVDHEDYGHIRRRELQAAWEQFLRAMEERDAAAVAAIAAGGRRGRLGRFDPRGALPAGAPL